MVVGGLEDSVELDDPEARERRMRTDIGDDGPTSPPDLVSTGADELGIPHRIELAQSMGYQKTQIRNLLLK